MTKREMKRLFEVLEGIGLLWENGNKTLDRAHVLLEDVYRFSHLGVGRCGNKHEDWKKGAEELHASFKKQGLI